MNGADDHLSRISTMWTALRDAHGQNSEPMPAAKAAMIDRYAGAVYRYLLKLLRDVDAADEVFQLFALQFIQNGFRHADPERGRFRDYLKVSLLRLVAGYRQKRNRDQATVPYDDELYARECSSQEAADEFVGSCRDELLARAWAGLKAAEEQTGRPWHTVLHYRVSHPGVNSEQLAAALNEQFNPDRPITADGARQVLSRARARFAELLLDEIRKTIDEPNPDVLEQEVIDLGLHPYCRSVLKRKC